MKVNKIIIVLCVFVYLQSHAISLREQLRQLNAYWIQHPLTDKVLDAEYNFTSDRELIQTHLSLVERTLRTKTSQALSLQQINNRMRMLDVLHDYWQCGLFPRNTSHAVRTPYFIDKYGTACAVGQLIISSGNKNLARQISEENNNGYIRDLVLKYPQIKTWANEHGFTLEELAWIQPCYGVQVDTIGIKQPTCHNARNGYYRPDFGQLSGPLTRAMYRWQNNAWILYLDEMCMENRYDRCIPGKYKWEVKDGQNVSHTFTTELIAPPPASVSLLPSGDFSSCNGTVSASVQGGVTPFHFNWMGNYQYTASALYSVCEELITLYFWEGCLSNGFCYCNQTMTIQTGNVGFREETLNNLFIVPNPVSDFLEFESGSKSIPDNSELNVLTIQGQVVFRTRVGSGITKVNLSNLSPGLYFLKLDGFKAQRFVKE